MLDRLVKLYQEGFSLRQIADKFGVSHMTVKRELVKAGIELRLPNEAQANFLKRNPDKHPTKGKKQKEETKLKISKTIKEYLTPGEIERRREAGKKKWQEKSEEEKRQFSERLLKKFRETSKTGSKLEKYLVAELSAAGYEPEFHKEMLIENERMHIDIFLPKHMVAIEIDGPTHYEPIFGEEQLLKVQLADMQKNGLIVSNNMSIIRIRQSKNTPNKWERYSLFQRIRDVINRNPVKEVINLEII